MLDHVIYRRLNSYFKSISINRIYVSQWSKQDWIVSLFMLKDLMQTVLFRYRWTELFIFLKKEKIVNLL